MTAQSSSENLTNADAVVSVRGVSKTFPGTRALSDVDLDVRSGEVLALCGGNGSGKSTLIKILSGVYQADGGVVRIGEHELDAAATSPTVAHDLGVRAVHQAPSVFPDLSVAENLALGATFPVTRAGNVRWGVVRRDAREQIRRFNIDAKPSTLARDLPVATQTQLAIARAIHDVEPGAGLLILDEPTAALPAHEVHVLFEAVRALAAEGHAILFVSHRLDEVRAIADRVTVLRDGRVVATHPADELTEDELVEAIIGHRMDAAPERRSEVNSPPTLVISDLHAGPLRGVDLEVRPGEVVGVAGRLGSGRTELLRALYGDLPVTSGRVTLNGKDAIFSRPDRAISAGVVLVPEDRPTDGAFANLCVDENLDVGVLRQYWRGLGFRRDRMRTDAAGLRDRYRVRAASGQAAMSSLSGGNQQKAVFARWLRREPVLLLLDEPTQGVDVGARTDIHRAIREITDAGGAALIVLSDLEELAQIADRAVVLEAGEITARIPSAELSAFRLNQLIL